jgi:uncharacterized protein
MLNGLILLLSLWLVGCASGFVPVGSEPLTPAQADTLAQRGDYPGAARLYEKLASTSSGSAQNDFRLNAVRAWLRGKQFDDAGRVLKVVAPPLTADQVTQQKLLGVELALATAQVREAWQQLGGITEPAKSAVARQYYALKQRAAFATDRPADGIRAALAHERWLDTAAEKLALRRELLTALQQASSRGTKIDPSRTADLIVRGWLELGPLAAAHARDPAMAASDLGAWQQRYPDHPAGALVASDLLGLKITPRSDSGHVALLLPLSGRTAAASVSVREGFMTAYLQTPPTQRPHLRIYDTAGRVAGEVISNAIAEGAQWIVGPLTRDEVAAAAALQGPRPPILALNFLATEQSAPERFFQFALSPEEEARAVARRLLAEKKSRGIAIVPDGEWGQRVVAAFEETFKQGGGVLADRAILNTARSDYSAELLQVLRLSDSKARHRRIQSLIGDELQFEPQRRDDIDFIFMASPASTARLLNAQLRFHRAGNVATYATSDAYEPDPSANEDLQGLIFPDMPWMMGGEPADSVHALTQEAWPSSGPRRNRLFAFGYDAYRLADRLQNNITDSLTFSGLTGELSIDADRRILRGLVWAQLQDGQLQRMP